MLHLGLQCLPKYVFRSEKHIKGLHVQLPSGTRDLIVEFNLYQLLFCVYVSCKGFSQTGQAHLSLR